MYRSSPPQVQVPGQSRMAVKMSMWSVLVQAEAVEAVARIQAPLSAWAVQAEAVGHCATKRLPLLILVLQNL